MRALLFRSYLEMKTSVQNEIYTFKLHNNFGKELYNLQVIFANCTALQVQSVYFNILTASKTRARLNSFGDDAFSVLFELIITLSTLNFFCA